MVRLVLVVEQAMAIYGSAMIYNCSTASSDNEKCMSLLAIINFMHEAIFFEPRLHRLDAALK